MAETRKEHLQWCKDRALEFVDAGDLQQAFASFLSDMKKHSETADHIGLEMMFRLKVVGALDTAEELRNHIEGFN